MKKNLLGGFLSLLMILGAGSLSAAGSFEGEVDFNITAKNMTGTMNYFIKNPKVRVESQIKGKDSIMIMNATGHEMMMLMPQQKMYMVMKAPEKDKGKKNLEGKVTRTGRSEVILGHKCDEWLWEGKNGQASIWGASGMGSFVMGGKSLSADDWVKAVKNKQLFPLKMVYKDKSGNETMTMEATKIEKKSLSSSLFTPPADYKKMDMGAMMQGMMGGEK